jgi:hypothetical protein
MGSDQFTLSNSGSITPSSQPFSVSLASVGFRVECGTISITGDPFIQHQDLTDQIITLPVVVTNPGTTTVFANGAGMLFSSGEVNLTSSTENITLNLETVNRPTTSGIQYLAISSDKGGVLSACNIPVHIQPATATITSIALVNISPNTGNYIVDVNGDKPAMVTLAVISSSAGEYTLTSEEINGVTYGASGMLIASAAPQTVTLYPTGTPTAVTGKQSYTISSGSNSVSFDINYVYRAMTILVIGSNPGYNLYNIRNHINTSATGNTSSFGDQNFGLNGAVPTAGITLIHSNTLGGLDKGRLATLLNTDSYDIVLAGFDNNTYNAADVVAAVNYVNRNGVLFLATEGFLNAASSSDSGITIQSIMAQLFGLSYISYGSGSDLWYASTATNQLIFQAVNNTGDPILNGPFGDITGKYLSGDVSGTSRLIAGALPPTAIALASPLQGASVTPTGMTPSNSYYALRHSSLGFVWAGDSGFWGAFANRPPTTGGTSSPVNSGSPLNPQGWTPNAGSTLTGTHPVYNGQFLMNFLGYAIKYAGTHSRQ